MINPVKIAVDAMGGENSPSKVIKGIEIHCLNSSNIFYNIFGNQNLIEPIIKKSKSEIDQFFECKEIDENCLVALGKKNNDIVVTGNTSYELDLYFTSGYDPSELTVSVDFCYPILVKCWNDLGNDGYGSLIAQPFLNDYRHAEEKWVPALGRLTWDGTVIKTSKLIFVTPKGYVFRKFDPVVTITDPEGKINVFNLKNWKVDSLTD